MGTFLVWRVPLSPGSLVPACFLPAELMHVSVIQGFAENALQPMAGRLVSTTPLAMLIELHVTSLTGCAANQVQHPSRPVQIVSMVS